MATLKSIRDSAVMRLSFHCAISAGLLLGVGPATGHGLGERYDLPLPLGMYLFGAALVVAVSLLVPVAFTRASPNAKRVMFQMPYLVVLRWPAARGIATVVRGISAALFILLLAAGFFGSPDPYKNPLPVSVWIIGWVGIAYISAFLGNVWTLANPWDNLFRLGEWIASRRTGRPPPPLMDYPAFLGVWPAVVLFFMFAWMELVWPDRDHPAALAWATLIYSIITWSGMVMFGRRIWVKNGEAFAVAFGLLARFAIIGRQNDRGEDRIVLRPPAIGLLVRSPVAPSMAVFVILMLSTVTFDGLLETPLWAAISDKALASEFMRQASNVLGFPPYALLATIAMILLPMMFAVIFFLTIRLMMATIPVGATSVGKMENACLFILTVVPIAIGYHLSHYLSYLLIAGQFIIPIASDPFALGWNLFGTRLYLIDFSIIDARTIWYASLALIVAGHVIAVWLAHSQATRSLPDRSKVVLSQFPMLILMVGYTVLSLWILAQPITKVSP